MTGALRTLPARTTTPLDPAEAETPVIILISTDEIINRETHFSCKSLGPPRALTAKVSSYQTKCRRRNFGSYIKSDNTFKMVVLFS
jgi:hypothetical protein